MIIDVDRVAVLSKLSVSPDEKSLLEKQMNDIIAMAGVLAELDEMPLDNCECFALLREDTCRTSCITAQDIMRNAPDFKDGCFCVPQTVEQ